MPNDSDDSEGYKSPPASVDRKLPRIEKIPLDDAHTCPCCNGKGFVVIVDETRIERRQNRPVLTKWKPK